MAIPLKEKGYQSSKFWYMSEDIEDTPELIWPLSVEVYDRMRRQDAQVISVLRAVTLPIRRTPWRIDPAGASDEVTQLVADDLGLPILGQDPQPALRTRDRFSWKDHLRLSLLMLTFGHAFFEQVYRMENGQARLRKLGYRPPRTIADMGIAADGGLEWIAQQPVIGPSVRIPVKNLVAYVNDREGGNWLGQSLLRPAYKNWLLKDMALRTQSTSLDRNGLGVPIYTASEQPADLDPEVAKDRQDEEIAAGNALATAYRGGENAGASLPYGATLELKGVTGKIPDANPTIRYYDEQIARAVLAHFLNLGTETGSWALGSTFADFFTLSLQTVAGDIADVTTQHVVEDLVDINFGPTEPAPRITFDEIGSRHPATAEAIKLLTECGALTPDADLERFVRTMHGLPPADSATARPFQPAVQPAPTGGVA